MSNGETVTVCAVGDLLPGREGPEIYETVFELCRPILRGADVTFGQLERILSDRTDAEGIQYTRTVVDRAADMGRVLADAGFDVLSGAGNHHMDAGHGCFVDTLETIKQSGMLPVGIGMNIFEARAPAIVERKGVKVGFVAYSSIIPRCELPWEAQPNKPGCAPMFVHTYYEPTDWQPGAPPKVVSYANEADLEAMKEDIKKAKDQADVVVASFHWGVHSVPAVIAMYETEVGHAAIDAGADLVIGTHAHVLKGIEVYKGKVIFHCLGNFARMNTIGVADRDRFGALNPDFSKAEKGWEKYPLPPATRKSMIVKATIVDKKIEKVSYLPCLINQDAQPEPLSRGDRRSNEVYEYVKWACREVGMETEFSLEGDEVVIVT